MLDIESIEKKIGYTFNDKSLLILAFTHSSFSSYSYEKLEFLGDSILGFYVADYLYRNYPELNEGELTKARANIVDKPPLKQAIIKLGLENYIQLGVSEKRNHIEKSDKLCGDLYEAIVAGIYLDSSIENAGKFIAETLVDTIDSVVNDKDNLTDYKSKLLEYCAKERLEWHFEYDKSGADHSPIFSVNLFVDNNCVASAKGTSKKKAGETVSKIAYDRLVKQKN